MDKRLYIAYGSNLNVGQMRYRCPTAKIYGKGILQGYRLLFKGSKGNAYLTIEPSIGGKVPVVIWDIKSSDEMALDRYEGYPSFYYKENIEVELETGEVVTAMVYIMTNEIRGRIQLNLPSKNYLATAKEGYKDHGFDLEFIEEAIKVSKTRGVV
ncbi:gamma-glutamylcyclotransferase [Tissierella carlieri]|uniref:Gamma-glutamylcyclotransferase n=1 Tax=Tissierella carlieri TaxID=689904 RepID=A0ABT1S6W0_9FIRM|nr:gamma-glutamylcyclotransferase family protein [Tissierella carlieri]MCQ4922204.1 gamma-glutamylcyclotransferase [Tissierella carlieri]